MPVENAANFGNDGDINQVIIISGAVMGNTATSKAVKKTSVKVKKDSGTKKSARKAAPKKAKSRATPVKKKTTVRKKTAAPKKATSKKKVARKATAKKTAPRKKAATRTKSAQSPEQFADVTAIAATPPGPADATATNASQDDTKSLSWMAAQAASALKAVRANQNERAQELLAKAEITPATPVKAQQEDKIPAAPDAHGTKQEMQTDKTPTPVKAKAKKPAKSARPETRKDKKTDAAPKPDKAVVTQVKKASPAPSAPVAPEPAKQGAVQAAVSRATPAQPEVTENTVKDQQDIPPAHVIAATSKAPGKRRSKRLILLSGIIVIAGVLTARVWFSDNDTADIAAVQDSAGTEQISPVTAKPPIAKPSTEVITRVASDPAVKPAAATQTNTGTSPVAHPAWPEPASTPETLPTVAATPPETAADHAVATETPQQQATTQTTATAAQLTRPATPQPAYYAPAYGYYPQQPVRQQPYYRSRYSR